MKNIKFSNININNIEDYYDLPIESVLVGNFWTEVTDVFLLSFGRMMVKHDLGLNSFSLFLNLYKNSNEKIEDIDFFIENRLRKSCNHISSESLNIKKLT